VSETVLERKSAITNKSRSHRRLTAFVDWIKPDGETRDGIYKQAGEIRTTISNKATDDGLTVVATPEGGSFAKHTGLRRHMRGNHEIEGQDVDLPFVVKTHTTDGEKIDSLLNRFDKYAEASYPTTPRTITASSVEMAFVTSKLNYDLVPMLATDKADYQVILKKDGSRRTTSVQKHTEFVRGRTKKSDDTAGRVRFNECVRLIKWWRYIRIAQSGTIDEVRTTLIELLCASAFDRLGVAETYTETLGRWFGWIASLAKRRVKVSFSDYASVETPLEQALGNTLWQVIDPVNANNNLVHQKWGNIELDEFTSWCETARDSLTRILSFELAGEDGKVDELLEELFGTAVITHGELE
jgi:Second Messenger Oligonucleotide or Dinucleotide Synthetase domain